MPRPRKLEQKISCEQMANVKIRYAAIQLGIKAVDDLAERARPNVALRIRTHVN